MNSYKSMYVVFNIIFQLIMLSLAVFSPIYITPGYYWWTGFGIMIMFLAAGSLTRRLDSWNSYED